MHLDESLDENFQSSDSTLSSKIKVLFNNSPPKKFSFHENKLKIKRKRSKTDEVLNQESTNKYFNTNVDNSFSDNSIEIIEKNDSIKSKSLISNNDIDEPYSNFCENENYLNNNFQEKILQLKNDLQPINNISNFFNAENFNKNNGGFFY